MEKFNDLLNNGKVIDVVEQTPFKIEEIPEIKNMLNENQVNKTLNSKIKDVLLDAKCDEVFDILKSKTDSNFSDSIIVLLGYARLVGLLQVTNDQNEKINIINKIESLIKNLDNNSKFDDPLNELKKKYL